MQLAITTVLSQAVKINNEIVDGLILFLSSLVKFGPLKDYISLLYEVVIEFFSLLSHTS